MASSRERKRESRFESKMSDAEALMWTIEKDPWLNPSGAMVVVLDQPIDVEQFRRRLQAAVADIGRLRERVVPGLGRLSPPTWSTDPEFDFDYHVRHISLPGPGTNRQLFDLATQLYEDPYDRTRPLWMFVVIDGLEGGRGALFTKTHHAVADGTGLLRLAERYLELEREAELPPEVDLDAVIAADLERAAEADGAERSAADSARKTAGHLWRRQTGLAQRAVGELAIMAADPSRASEIATGAYETLATTVDQLGNPGEQAGGSPLWRNRSRHRRLVGLRIALDDVKTAGKALDGSINDVFVAGAINGALGYHAERNAELEALNVSFVVSTRRDSAVGGNSFTPALMQATAASMSPEDRFLVVRDAMAAKRDQVKGEGTLSGLAGVLNMLPTSVITQTARAQAQKMDFATSNMRGAPITTFVSGAKVLYNITMGPVSGTAFNMTTLSYDGSLDIGMFVDPVAVADSSDLAACMADAYSELLAAGGVKSEPVVVDG